MFRAIIELESLKDPNILNNLRNIKIVKKYKEHHPEANTKTWNVFKLKISKPYIKSVIKTIAKEIKHGWYALFWNKKVVCVVFKNKIFQIPRETKWKSGGYQKVKSYGLKHGIQENYLNFKIEDF